MEKVTEAHWQNWDGDAVETLTLRETEEAILAEGTITSRGKQIYIARYEIVCDITWRTKKCEIEIKQKREKLELESDGFGRWSNKSGPLLELKGAIDIDISATPFTNMLPIRRLKLAKNQSEEISVVYVSVPELKVSLERQRYTCLIPGRLYRFEQFDIGFSREIETGENGLVRVYPGLFKRL